MVDQNNRRVNVFDSAGHYLMAFGTGVVNGASEIQTCTSVCGRGPELGGFQPTGIAVDPSSHDIYVAEAGEGRIEKLAFNALTDKFELLLSFGSRGSGAGQLDGRSQLAVDSNGDVWVSGINRVQRFDGSGKFLSELSLSGAGELRGLAVDSSGDLYTLTQSSGEEDARQLIEHAENGTYTLSFGGYTSSPLPAVATKEEIQKALEALPSIGAQNVRVLGTVPGIWPCEGAGEFRCFVVFTGKLADTEVEQMSGSVGVTITTLKQGKPGTPGVLSKLKPNGEAIERIDDTGHPAALGIDPGSGDLYVSDQPGGATENPGSATLLRYSPSGEELEAFGAGDVSGSPGGNALAFSDSGQRVYLVSCEGLEGVSVGESVGLPAPGPIVEGGSTVAGPVRKTTATVSAYVNPEGKATTYTFQYITEAQFVKNEGEGHEGFTGAQQTALSASIGTDFSFHKVSVALTGLATATTYRFRIVAYNSNAANGVAGETASLATLPPATVEASVAEVTASSATLIAQINPLGDATTYIFQYITREAMQRNEEEGEQPFSGANEAPMVETAIGAGEEPVEVSQHIQGLSAHTAYRYRIVVVNAAAPQGFASDTFSFTSQAPPGAPELPDNRQWELVSPPNKHGALLLPIDGEELIQAAVTGDAIAYLADSPTEPEPQGFGSTVQVLSARGSAGWFSHDLAAAHSAPTGVTIGQGYESRAFSPDLSLSVLQPRGPFEQALSPEATEQTPYLRRDLESSAESVFCEKSCYRPLLTPEDVTSGNTYGTCPPEIVECGVQFLDATPNLSHIILSSGVGLTSAPGDKGGLYEWSEGTLQQVSVLPNGASTTGALGFSGDVVRGAVSSDGSRVFWATGHLYLRDVPKGETIELDAVQGGSGTGSPNPIFQLATASGLRAFFTDTQPLTSNSGASSAGADLYECQIEEEAAGHLRCALTDLTPITSGENGDAHGMMVGASEDGSYVYFVAMAALTDAPNEHGETAQAGDPNLYVRHEGVTSLVAPLSSDDAPDWGNSNDNLADLTARVSSDGQWLAFMSDRSLTGYDNRDAASNRPDEEVFLYHASGDGAQGKLICASCNPTGARPHGVEYGEWSATKVPNMPLSGGDRVWPGNQWIAANLPGWTDFRGGEAIYQPRYLSNAGRLFFDARDSLVPQDTNGTEDIYQFEPPQAEGVPPGDSCETASFNYVPVAGGCVSLISSGTSPEESAFVDASETGSDVFFLTDSRLSPLDVDGARDMYDAHVCSSESPCPPPPPPPPPSCQGDACQSPAVAPEGLTPSSLTFSGAGDAAPALTAAVAPKTKSRAPLSRLAKALRSCRRDKAKRKRVVCERRARQKYGSKATATKSRKGGSR